MNPAFVCFLLLKDDRYVRVSRCHAPHLDMYFDSSTSKPSASTGIPSSVTCYRGMFCRLVPIEITPVLSQLKEYRQALAKTLLSRHLNAFSLSALEE